MKEVLCERPSVETGVGLLRQENKFKDIKLTPPVDLDYFMGRVRSNAYVYLRDMCGEQYRDKQMFQMMNESLIEIQ